MILCIIRKNRVRRLVPGVYRRIAHRTALAIALVIGLAGVPWLQAAPPTSSPAASAVASAVASEDKSYEVEILVFENKSPELAGEEQWPPFVDKPEAAGSAGMKDAGEPDNPKPGSRLEAAATALRADPRYRVLAHKSWTQFVEAKKDTIPVRINDGEAKELDGLVRLYVSRFLHLDIDLALRGSEASQPIKQEPTSALAPTSATAPTGVALYRINEDRRVKSKEIHYFDHPKFGVVVYINSTTAK